MRPAAASAWGRLGVALMPLVDLVMLLVLFFALAQGVIRVPPVKVALPEARVPIDRDAARFETVLTVLSSGALYLNGVATEAAALESALPAPPATGTVRLRADGGARYGDVRRVLETLKQRGVSEIGLAVIPAEPGGEAGAP